jgi:predicted porin
MNKKLLTAVVGATLAVAGNAANAIDLKISGHLARGVMWADDGVTSETYHVDMTTAPSRIRFLASDDLLPGIKAGVNWENGFNSNKSGAVSQTVRGNTPAFEERWQEIWFSGAFGKIAFGQGDSAQKDVTNVDLSGTALAAGGAPSDIGGGLLWRTSGTGALLGATTDTVGEVLSNFDGSRHDRIRYDSPSLAGFVVSASYGYTTSTAGVSVDTNEFAVRVNMDLGGIGKLAGALGFGKAGIGGATAPEASGTQETTSGSVSLLMPMGLNFTVAHSQRENDAGYDADFTRFQVGYIMGEHAVSLGYAQGNDQVTTGDEAEQIALAYNFKPKPWADIFASVKQVSFDPASGADIEDMLVVLVGSRIVF